MKKLSVALTIALSFATMVALGAHQDPSSPTQQATKGSTVTVTGCVEQASPAKPTGTSGEANTPAPDTKFVLTSRSSDTTAGTSGTSTTSPMSKVTFRLDDADQAKVSAHEGHKVQITGTVLEEGQAAQAQAGEESKAPAGTQVQVPKIRVDSVKMIASTCGQQ